MTKPCPKLSIKLKIQRTRQYLKDLKDKTKRVSQTKIQQLTQFIRRHRRWFIAGTAVVTGVLLTAISTYLYRRRQQNPDHILTKPEIQLEKIINTIRPSSTSASSSTYQSAKSPSTSSSSTSLNKTELDRIQQTLQQIETSVKQPEPPKRTPLGMSIENYLRKRYVNLGSKIAKSKFHFTINYTTEIESNSKTIDGYFYHELKGNFDTIHKEIRRLYIPLNDPDRNQQLKNRTLAKLIQLTQTPDFDWGDYATVRRY